MFLHSNNGMDTETSVKWCEIRRSHKYINMVRHQYGVNMLVFNTYCLESKFKQCEYSGMQFLLPDRLHGYGYD